MPWTPDQLERNPVLWDERWADDDEPWADEDDGSRDDDRVENEEEDDEHGD